CRQTLRLDRLEQGVERADLESAHGMGIVCCREDDARHVIEAIEQVENRATRHLDVQENQLRRKGFDAPPRFIDIARLSHYLDPRELCEQPSQLASRQRFVIDDERFHGTTAALVCGTRMRTMAMSDCDRSMSSAARAPNSRRKRSVALYRPDPGC